MTKWYMFYRAAERAILEISELQNQLMMHVAAQAKETERLYEEAIASTDLVREGNQQLLEAGRQSADTRKWILFLLIVASLILLFLDWYG
jgi:syntaxin 18